MIFWIAPRSAKRRQNIKKKCINAFFECVTKPLYAWSANSSVCPKRLVYVSIWSGKVWLYLQLITLQAFRIWRKHGNLKNAFICGESMFGLVCGTASEYSVNFLFNPETLNVGWTGAGGIKTAWAGIIFCSLGILKGALSDSEFAEGIGSGGVGICCFELRRHLKSVKRGVTEMELFEDNSFIAFRASPMGFLNHVLPFSSGDGLLFCLH